MRLATRAVSTPYRSGRFAIAGHAGEHATSLLVTLHDEGITGTGEAVPSPRVTGMDRAEIQRRLDAALPDLRGLRIDPDRPPPELPTALGTAGPAACAVDGAILDLWAQRRGEPLWRALGLRRTQRPTPATVSLAEPDAMHDEAGRHLAAGFHHLKIKLGEDTAADQARLRAVRRAAADATLYVDGNEGWRRRDALAMVPALAEAEVALLEQPLARTASPADHHALNAALEAHGIPHVLDEAVHSVSDVERIARGRLAHGVNLKLQKAGGLRAGLAVLDAADAGGLHVFLGCFLETWAGISLAAQLVARAHWVDLDGAWLLAEEPVRPRRPFLRDGRIGANDAPGLGIHPPTTDATPDPP